MDKAITKKQVIFVSPACVAIVAVGAFLPFSRMSDEALTRWTLAVAVVAMAMTVLTGLAQITAAMELREDAHSAIEEDQRPKSTSPVIVIAQAAKHLAVRVTTDETTVTLMSDSAQTSPLVADGSEPISTGSSTPSPTQSLDVLSDGEKQASDEEKDKARDEVNER